MKALALESFDGWTEGDGRPDPVAGAGEVLVRIARRR